MSTERVSRLAQELRGKGFDAYFCWSPVSMTYLFGFGEGAGERFLTLAVRSDGTVRAICPALSATQVRRSGIADVRPWKDGDDPLAHFCDLADDWNLRNAQLAVDDELPAHMLLSMQKTLPSANFAPGSALLSTLMRVKDPEELDLMRQAARIADDALAAGLAALKPGATELDVEEALTSEMRRRGGKPAFCIVAAGANGAEPHHLSDETVLKRGDVVVLDFGCTVGGYYSDITRMAAVGEASDEAKAIYRLVREAHMAGRSAIRPGVAAEQIDAAARRVIDDAGHGELFMHRLGHGIGMKGHEDPNMVMGNKHGLEVGNCFSIEPGVYFPGRFGVRIENIVTVTENGHESFNEEPSEELTIVP